MPKNSESLNNDLFNLLRSRGYEPTLLGTDGKEIPVPDEAEVFQFHFIKDDEDYGPVTISIDGMHKLVIYFNDKVAKSPSEESHNEDTSWYSLLNHLKRFSQQHQLSFEVKNTDHLKYDMAKRNHMKKVDEGRMIKGAGGVPLDRQGNEIPPKEVAPKMARVAKPKTDYDKIWFDVTNIISNIFPDGDPADYLPKYCRKHGLTYDDIRKAARKNGYKDEYEYIDQMKTGDYGYEEPVREQVAEGSGPKEKQKRPFQSLDQMRDTAKQKSEKNKQDKKASAAEKIGKKQVEEGRRYTGDSKVPTGTMVEGQMDETMYDGWRSIKSKAGNTVHVKSEPAPGNAKLRVHSVHLDKKSPPIEKGKHDKQKLMKRAQDGEFDTFFKKKVEEGYYATGRKSSYSDAVPQVKIILQHSRQLEEGERRYRAIDRIFVENAAGERFLLDTKKPGLARVYARHIAEGGTPYDEQGKHIHSLVEEYTKMAGFVRATRNGQFNESTQSLVNEGVNHYNNLREQLHKMSGHRGYTAYFESWAPTLTEDEDTTDLSEMFASNELDPRIESVMPILRKLNKNITEVDHSSELAEWADGVIDESLGLAEVSKGLATKAYAGMRAADSLWDKFAGKKEQSVEEAVTPPVAPQVAKVLKSIGYSLNSKESMPGELKSWWNKPASGHPSMADLAKALSAVDPSFKPKPNYQYASGAPEQMTKSTDGAGQLLRAEFQGHGNGGGLFVAVYKRKKQGGLARRDYDDGLDPSGRYDGMNEGDGLEALNAEGIPEEVEHDMAEGSLTYGNKCAGPFASEDRARREASRISKELGVRRYVEKTADGKYIVVKKQGVAEDISPEQKRVGQLGPKDKVGKKGAVGKLVGACESVEDTGNDRLYGYPEGSENSRKFRQYRKEAEYYTAGNGEVHIPAAKYYIQQRVRGMDKGQAEVLTAKNFGDEINSMSEGTGGRGEWDPNSSGYQGDYAGEDNWGNHERDDERHDLDQATFQLSMDGDVLPKTYSSKELARFAGQALLKQNPGAVVMLKTVSGLAEAKTWTNNMGDKQTYYDHDKPKKPDFAAKFKKNLDKTKKQADDTEDKIKQHDEKPVKEGVDPLDALKRLLGK